MKLITFILIFHTLTTFAAASNRVRRFVNLNNDGGRVVGGEEIRIEEVPYQASLRYFGYHICGGSIITADFIITAAHCE
jgi:trypsin